MGCTFQRLPCSPAALVWFLMSWSHLVVNATDWTCGKGSQVGTFTQLTDCLADKMITVDDHLSLTGRPGLTTIKAATGERHFVIRSSSLTPTLDLKWIKLTGSLGDSSGGIQVQHGTLRTIECLFYQNRNNRGGGIEAFVVDSNSLTQPTLILNDTKIIDNVASGEQGGGGVYQSAGSFTMFGGFVEGNNALNEGSNGGGLYFAGLTTVTITKTTIASNHAYSVS